MDASKVEVRASLDAKCSTAVPPPPNLNGSDRDDGSSRRGWITGGRGLLGTGLALAAFLAVVLTAISVPGDDASAQVADPATEVEKRAAAWWGALTPDERVNVLLGKDNDPNEDGHQTALGVATTADANLMAAKADYADQTTGTDVAQSQYKEEIDAYVDGNIATDGDIYAVGEHLGTSGQGIQAIRGWQSVELWWEYLTCTEARIAVGEDSGDLQVIGGQAETSGVCVGTLNTAGDAIETANVKPYSQVKDVADRVGQAILGLDEPGSKSVNLAAEDRAKAEAWWIRLATLDEWFIPGKDNALYGDGANVPGVNVGYADLSADAKALVNDRWQWIYDGGGTNDEGIVEMVYWWDNLSCSQRIVAIGLDNEPNRSAGSDSDRICRADWDALDSQGSSIGVAVAVDVFRSAKAILGVSLPDAEAWWDSLSNDQRVQAVYGDPPLTGILFDDDNNANTAPVGRADRPPTADEKAVFEKSYRELSGGIEVSGPNVRLATHLHLFFAAELRRYRGVVRGTHSSHGGISVPVGEDTDGDGNDDRWYHSSRQIVDGMARMLFDPSEPAVLVGFDESLATGPVRTWLPDSGNFYQNDAVSTSGENKIAHFVNTRFDWPYKSDNSQASVADWWGTLDCRLKRMAVGEDNQYLNAEVEEDLGGDPPRMFEAAEESDYCRHFPGSAMAMEDDPETPADESNILIPAKQKEVEAVGMALLGLSKPGRPSFNVAPSGEVSISGAARVGSVLTAEGVSSLTDGDNPGGIPSDAFEYRWIRVLADGTKIEIPGATGSSYTLRAADAGKAVLVRVSYVDGEEYLEELDSLATSTIVGSLGVISKIEPGIQGVTVSAGDKVVLSVKAYGRQGIQDQKLSAGSGLSWTVKDGAGIADDDADTPWEITYTAPASPGRYTIVASFANDGDCVAKLEERDEACSAEFEVRVRRPSAVQPEEEAAMNPPGEIPGILADDDGNQYAVFTPEGGGTFSGAGYSITAAAGAVPNGEFIGVRMSDDGAASNLGMTHQRYTLGGNMYGVHAVDGTAESVSSYSLDDPATVCLPLPAELRRNISDLAVVAMNGDGSLTILSAQVRISGAETMVCGGLSTLPASVAVGSAGAPSAIPTSTPEPTAVVPDTGGGAPSSSGAVWMLTLGTAVLLLGIGVYAAFGRRGRRGFITSTTHKRE